MTRLSAHTCITNPSGLNPWKASVESALQFFDEVVIVDGSTLEAHQKNKESFPQVKWVHYPWAENWDWEEWVFHFNKGLEICTGDWAIRFDTDYVFIDWQNAHEVFESIGNKVATISKISAVTSTKFYNKGKMPLAINKKYDICFGKGEEYTDLLVPIEREGVDVIPYGKIVRDYGNTGLAIINYDHIFKTKEQIRKGFLKYSKAHKKYYGFTEWGETEEESLNAFIEMMRKRIDQVNINMEHKDQPDVMREYLAQLTPEHYGFNAWGMLK